MSATASRSEVAGVAWWPAVSRMMHFNLAACGSSSTQRILAIKMSGSLGGRLPRRRAIDEGPPEKSRPAAIVQHAASNVKPVLLEESEGRGGRRAEQGGVGGHLTYLLDSCKYFALSLAHEAGQE